jgi:hypothetical protein
MELINFGRLPGRQPDGASAAAITGRGGTEHAFQWTCELAATPLPLERKYSGRWMDGGTENATFRVRFESDPVLT